MDLLLDSKNMRNSECIQVELTFQVVFVINATLPIYSDKRQKVNSIFSQFNTNYKSVQ